MPSLPSILVAAGAFVILGLLAGVGLGCGSVFSGGGGGDDDVVDAGGGGDDDAMPAGFTRLVGRTWSLEPGQRDTYKCVRFTVTEDTYIGGNGYSLRLRGLEEGVNDMAWDRAIVMHGAYYVSREAIKALGRLGRSWGCPAVRAEIADKVIDTVRGGSAIFAYYPDKNWLASSAFLPHR